MNHTEVFFLIKLFFCISKWGGFKFPLLFLKSMQRICIIAESANFIKGIFNLFFIFILKFFINLLMFGDKGINIYKKNIYKNFVKFLLTQQICKLLT